MLEDWSFRGSLHNSAPACCKEVDLAEELQTGYGAGQSVKTNKVDVVMLRMQR
jgi:hypothetical protein